MLLVYHKTSNRQIYNDIYNFMGGRNCFYDKKMVNYKDEYTKFKLFNRFASAFRRLSAIAYGKGTGRAAGSYTADDRRGIKEKTLRACRLPGFE